jgi:hypothetical protein
MDLERFTPAEREVLRRSVDIERPRKRIRITILTAALLIALLLVAGLVLRSVGLLLAVVIAYVILNTAERVAYGNAVLLYKSTIRKLVDQLPDADVGVHGP